MPPTADLQRLHRHVGFVPEGDDLILTRLFRQLLLYS